MASLAYGRAVCYEATERGGLRQATEIAMDDAGEPPATVVDTVTSLATPDHCTIASQASSAFDLEDLAHDRRDPCRRSGSADLLLRFPSPQGDDLAERNRPGEIDKGTAFIMGEVDRLIPGLSTAERAIVPWLMWEYNDSGGSSARASAASCCRRCCVVLPAPGRNEPGSRRTLLRRLPQCPGKRA